MTLVTESQVEDVPEGRNALVTLDSTGDTRLYWDPDNAAEVAAARASFDALKAKGYTAYALSEDDEQGRVIQRFDASARKMILTPALVGG